jgi:predicted RNase H-like HicB family nuclease
MNMDIMLIALKLEGCQTQGDSLEEVVTNIKEAVELYLKTLPDTEKRDV